MSNILPQMNRGAPSDMTAVRDPLNQPPSVEQWAAQRSNNPWSNAGHELVQMANPKNLPALAGFAGLGMVAPPLALGIGTGMGAGWLSRQVLDNYHASGEPPTGGGMDRFGNAIWKTFNDNPLNSAMSLAPVGLALKHGMPLGMPLMAGLEPDALTAILKPGARLSRITDDPRLVAGEQFYPRRGLTFYTLGDNDRGMLDAATITNNAYISRNKTVNPLRIYFPEQPAGEHWYYGGFDWQRQIRQDPNDFGAQWAHTLGDRYPTHWENAEHPEQIIRAMNAGYHGMAVADEGGVSLALLPSAIRKNVAMTGVDRQRMDMFGGQPQTEVGGLPAVGNYGLLHDLMRARADRQRFSADEWPGMEYPGELPDLEAAVMNDIQNNSALLTKKLRDYMPQDKRWRLGQKIPPGTGQFRALLGKHVDAASLRSWFPDYMRKLGITEDEVYNRYSMDDTK